MIGDLIITALAIGNITMVILLLIQRRRYRHIRQITKPCRDNTREVRRQNNLMRDMLGVDDTDD